VQILDNAPAVADSRSQKLTVAGFEIEGVSIAGQETCIVVPRAKVTFDIGRCPQRAVFQQTVLITHGHLDHIGGVPFHVASRQLLGLPPSKVVVPPPYKEGVVRLVEVTKELQGNPPTEYEVLPLKVGEEMQLPSGFLVRPFATSHTVASQGYLLYSQRKKLRADLAGRSQEEIRDLRLAGEEVTETMEVPEIAFTGDTTSEFLDMLSFGDLKKQQDRGLRHLDSIAEEDAAAAAGAAGSGGPGTAARVGDAALLEDVLRARLLVMEMTFIDDSVTVEQAREKGHMHIADFVGHAHRFQNEAILLIHFSSRYKRSEIIAGLNTWLPPGLRAKVVPFLNGITD